MKMIETPTAALRFVKRYWDDGTNRGACLILQQQWCLGAAVKMAYTERFEWRDVPIADEDTPRWLDGTPMRREH